MVFAAAATAIVSIGVTFSSGGASHPGGDPTGSVLRALETDVSSALAPNTHVVRSRPEETRWLDGYEACDGHVGWLPVTTEVMFTSPASTARVFETADATLTRQGWTSTSTADSMGWTRTSDGMKSYLILQRPESGAHPRQWSFYGRTDPKGSLANTC